MDSSEVGLVASQIVTSLGADWDQSGFEALIRNANEFQFGTFLTLLEKRYLADVDQAGLVEALNAVTNTFIDDIIKKSKTPIANNSLCMCLVFMIIKKP